MYSNIKNLDEKNECNELQSEQEKISKLENKETG